MSLKLNEDRIYATVLADGKMHVTVPEGTEGAKVRKYKTSDGKEGSKTEFVYSELIGLITNVAFREGDYGTQLQLTVVDGDEKPIVLSLSTSSTYGEDMMKKLINVDMSKYVKIVPYSFTDKGKAKKGVTIYQKKDGETVKIENYFYDTEKKCPTNGIPEIPEAIKKLQAEKKKVPVAKWKKYFDEVREFLIEKITEHFDIKETPTAVSDDDFDREVEELSAEADKAMN